VVAAARARGLTVEWLQFREEGPDLAQVRNKELFVSTTADWLARWLTPR
jgi:hypothetical protein